MNSQLLQDIFVAALAIFTLGSMGLKLTFSGLRATVRDNPRVLFYGFIVNFLIVPLAALGLGQVFSIPEAAFTGLLLCAAAPGGGTGTLFTDTSGGDVSFSVALLVPLTVFSLVFTPLWMLPYVPSGAAGGMLQAVGSMAFNIFVFLLMPLLGGILVNEYRSSMAARLQPVAARISLGMLLTLVFYYLIAKKDLLLVNGYGVLWASIILLAGSLASGFLFVRKGVGHRRAFGITTAVRNISLALLLSTTTFRDEQTLMAVLGYALLMNLVVLPVAFWFQRRPPMAEQLADVT